MIRSFMISYVRLLMLLVVLSYWGALQAQTLTITGVTPNPVCAGSAITISYDLDLNGSNHDINEIFNFYIFLNGPNTVDVRIGSVIINGGYGTLQGAIPSDRYSGVYSVRLIMTSSNSPTMISSNNSSDFIVNQRPVPPTTTVVNVCQNQTAVSLATGITSGANLRWYVSSSGGVASPVAPAPPTAHVGDNTYYVSQMANGCESDRAAITYHVKDRPPVPTVSPNPVKYCQNATAAPLTATTAQNGILNFYLGPSGGTQYANLIPSTTAGNNYYVSQVVDGCEGPRATISVTINTLPSVAINGLDNTYCRNAAAVTLSGSPDGGDFSVDGAKTTLFSPGSLSAGLHTVTYSYTDQAGCSNSTSKQITIHPTAGQWLGQVDKNWNNAANWSCGLLPTAAMDVMIPVTSFMPEIAGIGAVCHDLTIATGASLTISGQLDIKGNIVSRGTLQVPGTIIFSGDAQVIPAGTYSSVSVQGTGIKELAGNVKVTGTLSFSGSYLQLGSYDLLMDNGGNISGYNKNGFVITDGTGRLKRRGLGNTGQTGFVTFPIGTSTSSYTPLLLKNTGADDEFGVSVISGIYGSYDADENPSGAALTSFSVNKTWRVSEQVLGGSVATLTFQWNEADEQPGFLRNNCFGSHYYDGRWNQSATTSTGESEPYAISITGITRFSPFGVGSAGSALPLKLLAFTANPNGEHVSLSWQTTSELNTLGFDIETSSDAVHFSKVGNVAASNNKALVISTYHFSDANLKSGDVSYYRLKMLDQDGTFSYSKIISIRNPEASNNNYQIFPNPVTEQHLTIKAIKVRPGSVVVSICDAWGRCVFEKRVDATAFSSQQFKIAMQNFNPGCNYILKIDETATGISEHFKFFLK